MEKGERSSWGHLQLSASMHSKLSLKGNGSCWAARKVKKFGKSEIPNMWNHRPIEYPGLEGTHKDNKSPTPPSVCWKFDKFQFFHEFLALWEIPTNSKNYSLGLGTAALGLGAWDGGAPTGTGTAQSTWRRLN